MRESSLEAYNGIRNSQEKQKHYQIILSTLSKIGASICKRIEDNCELSYHQIQRRMKELETQGKVSVVGRELAVKNRPMIWDLKTVEND